MLAHLAARHLLDGFSVELVDGEASSINGPWINSVMAALQEQTMINDDTPSRVFVLSVAGAQSSGKSTLLNLMFGCRFRTAVGRCTKGSFMQLVRTKGTDEYQYVLIVDCEGVGSGELGDRSY